MREHLVAAASELVADRRAGRRQRSRVDQRDPLGRLAEQPGQLGRAARGRPRTSYGDAPPTWMRSSRVAHWTEHLRTISSATSSGVAAVGVDRRGGDRLVERRALVEQRLDAGRARCRAAAGASVAEADPLDRLGEPDVAGTPPGGRRAASRVSASSTAPPPSASTPSCSASAAATAARSRSRKYGLAVVDEDVGDRRARSRASMSASVSRSGDAPAVARAARPTVVLPAPIGPTSTTRGPLQSPDTSGCPGSSRRCGGSRRRSRRRTSRAPRRRAPARPSPRRRRRRRARRRRRSAGGGRRRPRRWRRRRCAARAARWRSASSPRGRAAPRRSSCRPRCRRSGRDVRRMPSSVGTISSCAGEPGVARELEAVADLDALDRLDAHQRAGQPRVEAAVPVHVRAEAGRQAVDDAPRRRRRGCRRPCGPGRSRRPSRSLAVGVEAAHRVGVERARRRRGRAPAPAGARTPPSSTTWVTTLDADGLLRGTQLATAPSATRAAVSRALARSRTGRASSKSYFCMPTRSAWPGRGRVSGALRASASSIVGVDRVGRHHLRPTWATRCCRSRRRPGRPSSGRGGRRRRSVTSSCSNFIRAPRP